MSAQGCFLLKLEGHFPRATPNEDRQPASHLVVTKIRGRCPNASVALSDPEKNLMEDDFFYNKLAVDAVGSGLIGEDGLLGGLILAGNISSSEAAVLHLVVEHLIKIHIFNRFSHRVTTISDLSRVRMR